MEYDETCQPLEKICSEGQYRGKKKRQLCFCLNLSIMIFKKEKVVREINEMRTVMNMEGWKSGKEE